MSKPHTLRITGALALTMAAMGLAACAGMTQQEKNTAIGAGVGAVGGSILTGGSTAGTVGGAAVGVATMLETIAVILLVLWLVGLVSSYTMGGFIHILLVIAVVVVL
eukprot:gene32595-40224_t